jgi:hypothetical protein
VGGDAAGAPFVRSTLPVEDAVVVPALRKVREGRGTRSYGGFCRLKAGPPATRSCGGFCGLKAGHPPEPGPVLVKRGAESGASHPQDRLIPSSSRYTRETATGGAAGSARHTNPILA